jgi:hypothetical protein
MVWSVTQAKSLITCGGSRIRSSSDGPPTFACAVDVGASTTVPCGVLRSARLRSEFFFPSPSLSFSPTAAGFAVLLSRLTLLSIRLDSLIVDVLMVVRHFRVRAASVFLNVNKFQVNNKHDKHKVIGSACPDSGVCRLAPHRGQIGLRIACRTPRVPHSSSLVPIRTESAGLVPFV